MTIIHNTAAFVFFVALLAAVGWFTLKYISKYI